MTSCNGFTKAARIILITVLLRQGELLVDAGYGSGNRGNSGKQRGGLFPEEVEIFLFVILSFLLLFCLAGACVKMFSRMNNKTNEERPMLNIPSTQSEEGRKSLIPIPALPVLDNMMPV